MKLFRTFFPFLFIAVSFAQAETLSVWAPGVTKDNRNYFDFNKQDGSTWDTDDSNLCWAAASANVIAWWQEQNNVTTTQSSRIPRKDDVWQTFVAVFDNEGYNPRYAFDWWINGAENDDDISHRTQWGDDDAPTWISKVDGQKYGVYTYYSGGILSRGEYTATPLYDTSEHPVTGLLSNENIIKNCADDLVQLISSGYALTMEVATNDSPNPKWAEHAITLWGLDYHLDENKAVIDTVYITDSDVGNGLITAQIDGKGYAILGNNALPYRFIYADGMWSNPAQVPEPASTTLSLIALTALACRRKRK